ncbi:MAG: TatD family hydrolase [Dehalococcoidia bacterium]|jgi:TatD DNase family protein|nr:TatD family hydrolase [Dehalococcoidia bacterium]
MFIDTHAHIHQHASDESADIVERATAANVGAIITAGTTIEDSQLAIDMANSHARVFAGAGVHPTDIEHRLTTDDLAKLSALAALPQVVVMSEIGVDHQDKSPDKEWQAEAFHAQINIAREHSLPIVFHIREQADDYDAHSARDVALSILKETSAGELRGTAHYFQGRWDFAQELLDLGFNISFAKTLTRIKDLEETALQTPADRILVETDSYPQTFKKNRAKWTEPRDIPIVAEKLASLRGTSVEEIREATTKNALVLLGSRAKIVESVL